MPILLKVVRYKGMPISQDLSLMRDKEELTIGRSRENDLVLPDQDRYVSRKHATIRFENGGYIVQDSSASGTFVDSRDVPLNQTESAIHDGSLLTIGDFDIEVRITEDAAPYAAPADDHFFGGTGGGDAFFDQAKGGASFFDDSQTSPFGNEMMRSDSLAKELSAAPDTSAPGPGGESSLSFFDNEAAMSDHASADMQSFTPPEMVSPDTGAPSGGGGFSDEDFAAWFNEQTSPGAAGSNGLFGTSPPGTEPDQQASTQPGFFTPEQPPAPPGQHPSTQPGFFGAQQQPASPAPPQYPPPGQQTQPAVPHQPAGQPGQIDPFQLAFFSGLGLPVLPGKTAKENLQMMHTLGESFREVVIGLIQVLKARSELKNEFRMTVTTIAPVHNNPLKHFEDPNQAIQAMLGLAGQGYMGTSEAIREGFHDIKAHQVAMTAGMQAALSALLKRFDPEALESRLQSGLVIQKKSRYWDIFTEEYEKIAKEAEDNFNDLFGAEFTKVYQEQVSRLRYTKS